MRRLAQVSAVLPVTLGVEPSGTAVPRRAGASASRIAIALLALIVIWLGLPPALAPAGGPSSGVVDVGVVGSSDDAEEHANGYLDLASSDLELVFEKVTQAVGIRFRGIAIPPGAIIDSAWIQFTLDEVSTGPASLVVRAHDVADPATFSSSRPVMSRPTTTAGVAWTPAGWPTVGAAGADQRVHVTPLIQALVSKGGWESGNAVALIITGTGTRTAESFDGTAAPRLHIAWHTGP